MKQNQHPIPMYWRLRIEAQTYMRVESQGPSKHRPKVLAEQQKIISRRGIISEMRFPDDQPIYNVPLNAHCANRTVE